MKTTPYYIIGMLTVLILSQCNSPSTRPAKETDIIPGTTDTMIAPRDEDSKQSDATNQDSIHVTIKKSETKTISAKMVPESPVTFSFNVDEPASLAASVKPDEPNGNVRISVLIDPEGESDGPYSMDLKKEISKIGLYRIVVNENMMAGDRWTGTFKFTLSLK